jgi:ABC-type multidrug transport system ATPase subunit
MRAMNARVELEQVSKWYGRRSQVALRKVSVAFEPGAVTAVAGANGSGKTTLLRILAGSAMASRGTVRHRPRSIGYAPERFPGGVRFTPTEYLAHMGRVRGLPSALVARRTAELAARLGLEPFLGKRIAELSKGTVQKVMLAQALLAEPELLVLDEPWTGLDARAQRQLAGILAEVRAAGRCVVLSDHHELAVGTVADRICRLDLGRLVDDVPVAAGSRLAAWPVEQPRLVEFTGDRQAALGVAGEAEGVLAVEEDGPALRVRVAAADSDALLLRALELGLSVRRVEPLDAAPDAAPQPSRASGSSAGGEAR